MKKIVKFLRQVLSYRGKSSMSSSTNSIDIKLCPYCGKELRTSKAKQCAHCFKSWHDNSATPNSNTKELLSSVTKMEFHDKKDPRQPENFELLISAERLARDNRYRFIDLCNDQIFLTPDYDLPYIWVSNAQNALGNTKGSIATLIKGLEHCKKFSGILCKLGERYLLETKDVESSIILFSKAILAQEPSRSDYQSYLYFAYICKFSDYGNAGKMALRIARKISRLGDIDLDSKTQFDIKTLMKSDYERSQSLVAHFLRVLLEQSRIDSK